MYIRYMRDKKKMTGYELGRHLNITQQQISRYERGVTVINVIMLNKIINTLDLCWHDFIQQVCYSKSPFWQENDKLNLV